MEAVSDTGNQPLALVALLAGGLVGALLRVLLERLLRTPTPRRIVWTIELVAGGLFGVVLALPFITSLRSSSWVGSSLGGALTAYSGACAAYGFLFARSVGGNPLGGAVGHFLASTAVTTGGFVLVVVLWRAFSG